MDRTWDSGGRPGTDRWTGPGTVGGVQGQIDGQDLGQWGVSRDRYMDRTWDRGGRPGTYQGQIDGQDLGQWGGVQGQIDGQDLGQWGASRDR